MKRLIVAFSMFVFAAQAADAPSAEQLRALSQRTAEKQRTQDERVKGSNPSTALAPEKNKEIEITAPVSAQEKSKETETTVPILHKYESGKGSANVAPGSRTVNSHERRTDSPSAARTEPTQSEAPSGGTVAFDVVKTSKARYGIRLGTRLYAEIRRNVSSAEPGEVEIFLTKDAIGTRRTMSANTQLFAHMRVNSATKRLELVTSRGITPDGDEFELNARAFDEANNSGLAGIVQKDSQAIAEKGVSRGVIAAGKAATRAISQAGGIAGAAVGEGANSMIGDTDQVMQEQLNTNIVVYVSPQPLVLRVEKSF